MTTGRFSGAPRSSRIGLLVARRVATASLDAEQPQQRRRWYDEPLSDPQRGNVPASASLVRASATDVEQLGGAVDGDRRL
jgi:hypothetical protein